MTELEANEVRTDVEHFEDIAETQEAIYEWSLEQFGDQDPENPLIGAQEELGRSITHRAQRKAVN
jgi:hypothetical protein